MAPEPSYQGPLWTALIGLALAICAGGSALVLWAASESSSWTTLLAPVAGLAGVEIETEGDSGATIAALVLLSSFGLLGCLLVCVGVVWALVIAAREPGVRRTGERSLEQSKRGWESGVRGARQGADEVRRRWRRRFPG